MLLVPWQLSLRRGETATNQDSKRKAIWCNDTGQRVWWREHPALREHQGKASQKDVVELRPEESVVF